MVSRKSPSLTFPVLVYWKDISMQPHRNIYSPKISIITLFGDSLQSANPIVKKNKLGIMLKHFTSKILLLFPFQFA